MDDEHAQLFHKVDELPGVSIAIEDLQGILSDELHI